MTAREIIAKSIASQAKAFRAALTDQAAQHDKYRHLTEALTLNLYHNPQAVQAARTKSKDCVAVHEAIVAGDLDAIVSDRPRMVIALNIAGKLLGLPRDVVTAAALSWEEGNR